MGTVILAATHAQASGGTYNWKTSVMAANTPETAYAWNSPDNWQEGSVPADHDVVNFAAPSATYYVRLPDTVTLFDFENYMSSGKSAHFIGTHLRISSDTATFARICLRDATYYGDLEAGGLDDNLHGANFPYISYIQLAGRAIAQYRNFVPASGTVAHRLDKFAYSSNPLRTDDFQIASNRAHNPGNASVAVYAPQGADACSGVWSQLAEGSPYLQRVSSTAHPLAVGTLITGSGIKEGTFLKHVFSDSLIELSEVPTAAVENATLNFAAFTPNVRISVPTFQRMGSGMFDFKLFKYREQDTLRYEMNVYSAGTMAGYVLAPRMGLTTNELATFRLGTHVFHKITGNSTVLSLLNVHFELAGQSDGSATAFPAAMPLSLSNAVDTARMTVPEGAAGSIGALTNFVGTLVKDGDGDLSITLCDGRNRGRVDVREGTLTIAAAATAGNGPLALGGLAVASGAGLVVPACGISVPMSSCRLPADAVIDGRERIYLTGGGADNYVHDPGEGEVAGHPMFWLDASKTNTMTLAYEGDNIYVTRWNDWREGEPMFCTNIVERPTLVWGDMMTNRYVKIARLTSVSNHNETQALVWNVPVGGIKAVFLVQDVADGGGEIIGRTMRLPNKYYGTQGGPYYRGWGNGWRDKIISPNYATACVKFGRFFLDGKEVVGYESSYLGPFMQVIEHHVNTNENASASYHDLWLDAFGVNYMSGSQYGKGCNGAMRIAEYIIYTNTLTHAERVRTAQYLSRKWLGKDIVYSDTDTTLVDPTLDANGADIPVASGETLSIGRVEGARDFSKSGDGRLVLCALDGGDVSVKGGEVIVKSLSLANTSVPAGAWLHMDASATNTLETHVQNGTNFVTTWHSLTTNGLRVVRYEGLGDKEAFIRENAVGGKPMVDLGPALGNSPSQTASTILRIQQADGSYFLHENKYSNFLSSPYLNSMFLLHSSSGGGGPLVGANSQGFPYYSFPHAYSSDFSTPVISLPAGINPAYTSSLTTLSNNYVTSKSVFHWDGDASFNPFTQPFTGGNNLFSWSSRGNTARKTDGFGVYGQTRDMTGGLAYGEIRFYENDLAPDVFEAVEAYLLKKWLNKDNANYRVARADSLVVSPGATVTVCEHAAAQGADAYGLGTGVMDVKRLGGCGTVNGNIRVADGGLVADVQEDGTVAGPLAVNGALDLSKGGAVTFTGATANLQPGRYPLVTATPLSFGGEWTCASPRISRVAFLQTSGNTLTLVVASRGTILLFR